MARESFLLNLEAAADTAYLNVPTSTPRLSADDLARLLRDSDRWLTPKTVEGFVADDFPELAPEKRRQLGREIEQFRVLAQGEAAETAAARKQVKQALPHLRRIVQLTGEALVLEWQDALDQFFKDVEDWSVEQDWAVRRDPKRMREPFLGDCEVPLLLVHTPRNNRFLLDPIARQVVGATGRVEMCLMPSYDSAVIVRNEGHWYVLPERARARPRLWSRQTFLDIATRLAEAA